MLVTHVRLSHVLLSHIQDTRGTTRRHRPGIELAGGTNALGMLHRGKRPEPRPFRQVTTAFRLVLVTGCKIGQIRPGQWANRGGDGLVAGDPPVTVGSGGGRPAAGWLP